MEKILTLASGSPRRKDILSFFSIPFEVRTPSFDEASHPFKGDVLAYIKELSEAKALSVSSQLPILAADTLVHREGKIYEKPKDDQEAFAILKELNGNWHTVYTSLSLAYQGKLYTEVQTTEVLFHKLDQSKLRRYHDIFQHTDKAGGYGIQKAGSIIVKEIKGCFYNVMGMPIGALQVVLCKAGINLWDYLEKDEG